MTLAQQILFDAFVENETMRLSDVELRAVLLERLTGFQKTIQYLTTDHKFSPIAKYRSQYNRGLLLDKQPPLRSFRYNRKVAVDRNNRPLTKVEQAALCGQHSIQDERFSTWKTEEVEVSKSKSQTKAQSG